MATKKSTRIPLIFAFVIAFFGTLVIITLGRSESGAGIIGYLPCILLAILGYTIHKRLLDKGEKPTPGSVIIAVILLMVPLINLFILIDLLSNKKKGYTHSSEDDEVVSISDK